ncbi:MAG TPA: ribosome silencing factor [Candidatus Krumholzibacteria bacterium]|nr:ribosome silencing factor [Candidatus Krumholzibacteria bacterium]HPD71265.1 ribosome silencing factor [Candidatus Krumholzibacteria bacterium]HRY39035.1 ribosome silencing factor [Candidatus Krumholzibacteria bacterium]
MTKDTRPTSSVKARPVMPDDSAGFRLAERVAFHVLERKGDDVVILDLRDLSDVCDFFVIASGQADVQVKAIARAVRDGLARVGQALSGSEGEADGRWILLDYVDVVVHVLKPEVRDYYQLERLWGDAAVLVVDPAYVRGADFRRRQPDLAWPGVGPGAAPVDRP